MISYFHCASCSKAIPEFDDDIVLTRRDGSDMRFYHARQPCSHAAENTMFTEGRHLWRFVYRPAFEGDGVVEEGVA